MAAPRPLVVVIGGPNGAGKSTTAPRLLQRALAVGEFVNADPIAQGLSVETTLASRSFAPWLETLRESGYRVHLTFLSLPSPEFAVARVAERVRQGGMMCLRASFDGASRQV